MKLWAFRLALVTSDKHRKDTKKGDIIEIKKK